MRVANIRCPYCDGVVNNMWFSHLMGDYAIFIVECWSGDLKKRSHHHLFKATIKLREVKENFEQRMNEIFEKMEKEIFALEGNANLQAYLTSLINEAKRELGLIEEEN